MIREVHHSPATAKLCPETWASRILIHTCTHRRTMASSHYCRLMASPGVATSIDSLVWDEKPARSDIIITPESTLQFGRLFSTARQDHMSHRARARDPPPLSAGPPPPIMVEVEERLVDISLPPHILFVVDSSQVSHSTLIMGLSHGPHCGVRFFLKEMIPSFTAFPILGKFCWWGPSSSWKRWVSSHDGRCLSCSWVS